jgi:hypothetical protein
MGMFDWYQPAQKYACPVCGIPLKIWQGKDGPCGLFVWQEGEKYPVDQLVDDEVRSSVEERQQCLLPLRFWIYSYDCPDHYPIDALGTTQDGVWSFTSLQPFQWWTQSNLRGQKLPPIERLEGLDRETH